MWQQGLLLTLGLVLLIKGANWLVDGGSALAKKYSISDLAIGLTIVAFGTSAPELVVNIFAAGNQHHDIVFGNILGSNIFNLFAILGIVGIIGPITVQSSTVWKEIPISFLAILVLFLFAGIILVPGKMVRLEGILLLLFFTGFLVYVYKQLKTDPHMPGVEPKNMSNGKIWAFILIGLAGLVLGGRLVVNNAVAIASYLGVPQNIIGLTIVAAGTSLPELVTSVVAAMKKNNDIAVGNIIGSNIFNIFLILGVSTMVSPILYNPAFNRDVYLLAGGTLFLFIAMFTGKKKKLDRWEASILLLVYIGYTFILIRQEL
jgi:cation:H+ antiporter